MLVHLSLPTPRRGGTLRIGVALESACCELVGQRGVAVSLSDHLNVEDNVDIRGARVCWNVGRRLRSKVPRYETAHETQRGLEAAECAKPSEQRALAGRSNVGVIACGGTRFGSSGHL
jgi:hypothetical protein